MKIAIIGSGISGLASAWLLAGEHEVTLFEADRRLGGHSHTVDITLDGIDGAVDTGFLVHNDRTYPNLIALFAALGIRTHPSDMSFSVRIEDRGIEWCGTTVGSVFAQRSNLARPAFWAMLRDILRFNRDATRLLAESRHHDITLEQLLERERYGTTFRDWYLLPMGAAIWSCPTRSMLAFPAQAFLAFCSNHGLLQLHNRPQWKTVIGGSRTYVQRMAAAIPDIRRGMPIREIQRLPYGVRIMTDSTDDHWDHVILACHSDQALALLADADHAESAILSEIRYQPNRAVLHTDTSFLPDRPRAHASWNYLTTASEAEERPVSVTYLLNRLQPLPFRRPVMVTLNPHREPDIGQTLHTMDYAHPVLDRAAWLAQARLDEIQGMRRTWFAGAWTGYGFHEDGLRSALCVANALGSTPAWQARTVAAS